MTEQPRKRFDRIELRNVMFHYVDKSSEAVFQVGPVDFTLRSGDLVFITGGNGSGKSTLLKVLAGLYQPDFGEILLDGVHVDESNRDAYRALIAAIFVDYHLFQRLYGIADPDPAEVDRLLTEFRLRDKTRLTDGEFSTLDLSGGQRKRLALIVSLLEKRPILLLDEWTADQDPDFRRKFYDELLPALKRGRQDRGGDNARRSLSRRVAFARSQASHGRRSFRRAAIGGERLMKAYLWSVDGRAAAGQDAIQVAALRRSASAEPGDLPDGR